MPATAVSGSERSHSKYGLPMATSSANVATTAAHTATSAQNNTDRSNRCRRASWRFTTSSFSAMAARPSGSVSGTGSPRSTLTGVSNSSESVTSMDASGTESPCSHLDTV